ncbi:hypothetical protein PHISP_05043 [Aspergillus sp. HF37]|nr:hypothetical protein PHISP_05043 [Aspergillus sp. HF37]
MAIHSRSSVRQDDPTTTTTTLLPPTKRPRLRSNPPPYSRRKSSPDLLDTVTTLDCDRLPPSSPIPPTSSLLRPPPPASSPASPRHPRVLEPNYETPSANAAALYLHGDRESPDPLDTITPVTATKPSATTTGSASPPVAVDNPPNTARTTRKSNSQPAPTASIDPPPVAGRRSLRSQDVGSRPKCELASYFHNYDELLSLAPPKPESLAGDTTVNLIDDLPSPPSDPATTNSESLFGNPLVNIHGCEVVELPKSPSRPGEDPLNEGTYFRPHRRVERQEKQLRNIERERAQHEKLQVDRLLGELKGHDWTRVLGITGVSDAEKKLYEPKRGFFIKELSLLIEKFNIWRDEEKRRKFDAKEKQPYLRAETTPSAAISHATAGSKRRAKHKKLSDADHLSNGAPVSHSQSHGGDPPDPDDVDAWAAYQLHQEARSASGKYPKPSSGSNRKSARSRRAERPNDPFVSPADQFPRDAAQGATSFAFGYPVPVMEEREFRLPPDILNEETIHASRRKLRRLRRERRTM